MSSCNYLDDLRILFRGGLLVQFFVTLSSKFFLMGPREVLYADFNENLCGNTEWKKYSSTFGRFYR